ncbi:MAG: aldehyde dehydrogenase family protein [Candidatus Neomarinimicrobiota bacterium]|nr:aldehyde dehydrogenase family protein [Candidatus Neomarinimicrobiota bacterium]
MSVRISEFELNVYNPLTGDEITSIELTTNEELDEIFSKARKSSNYFNHSKFSIRKKIIKKFSKSIAAHTEDLIDTICLETGKKEIEALMEVFISLEHLRESLKNLNNSLGKKSRRSGILKTRKVWIEYEPYGVACIISPWNYPLILTMTPLIEALLAGNSVILKSSEHTPLTTKLLKKIWDDSTNHSDLLQIVYGTGEIGRKLVNSKFTDIICFTGSTTIGKMIAQDCATMFKPLILELGGKDPLIVLPDADLERTINAALWGGMSNAGQTCISVEHIFVHEAIYSKFIVELSNKIKNLSVYENIGAVTVKSGIEKMKSLINENRDSVDIIEGECLGEHFFPPTILINPPLDSEIMKNEIFGPIMTVNSFNSESEVIKLANMSGYGLSASIFGKNKQKMKFIADRLKVGSICFNDVLTHYGMADLPFGGFGLSGIGKVHGKEGLRAFSMQKSYLSTKVSLKSEFWWFEKRENFGKLIKKWIKWKYS